MGNNLYAVPEYILTFHIHFTIMYGNPQRYYRCGVHGLLDLHGTVYRIDRVLGRGGLADTKDVTMPNTCEIGCAVDDHTGRILLSSAIDNLTKGASGQAVQNMNLVFGLEETAGLK